MTLHLHLPCDSALATPRLSKQLAFPKLPTQTFTNPTTFRTLTMSIKVTINVGDQFDPDPYTLELALDKDGPNTKITAPGPNARSSIRHKILDIVTKAAADIEKAKKQVGPTPAGSHGKTFIEAHHCITIEVIENLAGGGSSSVKYHVRTDCGMRDLLDRVVEFHGYCIGKASFWFKGIRVDGFATPDEVSAASRSR